MPRVAVLFTGGTISMRSDAGASGNVPTLRAEELLASVPGLDAIAAIEPIDWGRSARSWESSSLGPRLTAW